MKYLMLLIISLMFVGCDNDQQEIGIELYDGMVSKTITDVSGTIIEEWLYPKGNGYGIDHSVSSYIVERESMDTTWIKVDCDTIFIHTVTSSKVESKMYTVVDGEVY